jgi:hypothetical protein
MHGQETETLKFKERQVFEECASLLENWKKNIVRSYPRFTFSAIEIKNISNFHYFLRGSQADIVAYKKF